MPAPSLSLSVSLLFVLCLLHFPLAFLPPFPPRLPHHLNIAFFRHNFAVCLLHSKFPLQRLLPRTFLLLSRYVCHFASAVSLASAIPCPCLSHCPLSPCPPHCAHCPAVCAICKVRRGINKLFQWFSRNLRANILQCLQCLQTCPLSALSLPLSLPLSLFASTVVLLFVLAHLFDFCRSLLSCNKNSIASSNRRHLPPASLLCPA